MEKVRQDKQVISNENLCVEINKDSTKLECKGEALK